MKEEKDEKAIKIQLNPILPTLFLDNLLVTSRTDNHHLIRLTTSLPEGTWQEQVRFIVTREDLKRMLDTLCAISNHYPVKPATEPKPRTKLG